jgi:hypothetical protein
MSFLTMPFQMIVSTPSPTPPPSYLHVLDYRADKLTLLEEVQVGQNAPPSDRIAIHPVPRAWAYPPIPTVTIAILRSSAATNQVGAIPTMASSFL